MINIFIQLDINRCLKKFVVKGHSNYAKKGKDIVCAGVSSLAQAALISLKQTESVEFVDENGFLEIKINNYRNKDLLHGITLFLVNGLLLINKEYPNYLNIIIKEFENGTS